MNLSNFPPFPWQQNQWEYLIKRQQKNSLPHALLLTGQKGLGKINFAQTFSKVILCTDNKNYSLACGICRSCLLMQANSHPDFYLVQPEETSKIIKVDQVRELITQINQTSQQGYYKIAVLSPAEGMQSAASNALLKTLEEPTKNTLLILVSHQPSSLSATIRSRCQTVKFLSPSPSIAQQWLTSQLETIKNSELLLSLAEGAPLAVLDILEQDLLAQRVQLFQGLNQLLDEQGDPIKFASQWLKININQIINWLIIGISDIIRLNFGLDIKHINNKDLIACLRSIEQKTNNSALFYYLDKLYITIKQISSTNLNQQLLLEDLFCEWKKIKLC